MIKSGLVNRRQGGGFELGYSHQVNLNVKTQSIRPYVDGVDKGYSPRSDITQIITLPVTYSHIFSKNTTPDERNLLLKKIQKGGKRNIRVYRGQLVDETPPALPKLLTDEEIQFMDQVNDAEATRLNMEKIKREQAEAMNLDELPDTSDLIEDAQMNPTLQEALRAQDVVDPPPHHETFQEDMEAEEAWVKNKDVVEHTGEHEGDDINPSKTEISRKIKYIEKPRYSPYSMDKRIVDSNGSGPRHRYKKN